MKPVHRPSEGLAVGANIRRFRLMQGLTLKELAERSGVSIATISKIENGKIAGGFETVYKIARGLGILVTEIISRSGSTRRPIVRQCADQLELHPTALYDYYLQASRSDGALNPYVMVIRTRDVPERRDWSIHEGEEVVIVLSGAIVLHVEGEDATPLEAGDSACFDCGRRHCFVTTSSEPARIVSVSTRRAFSKLKTAGAESRLVIGRGGQRPRSSHREDQS